VKLETRNLKPEWIWILLLFFPMPGKAVEGARLVCDAPVCNFGQVDQSAVVTNVFVVRNEGDLTFSAGLPRTTCSCTKATINKRMIEPGETAELTAVFTAARRMGEQRKSIVLPPSDSDTPALLFHMQGFVYPAATPR
jgi:hypothetical protein